MKKLISTGIACVFTLTAIAGLVGCGDTEEEPEVADYSAPAYESADATLSLTGSIDKTTARNQISSDLFGLFLEDINFAGYALDDNLVSNYSFESTTGGKLAGWAKSAEVTSFTSKTSGGIFADNPDFVGTNPTYAEVVTAAGGYLYNNGYDVVPVAVKQGVDYNFSAFIKTGTYSGNLIVQVTDGSEVYAEKTLSLSASNEWVKYQAKLTAGKSGSSGLSVRVIFENAGTVLLDCVKLETADSTLGFKNYMYNAIADLSPAFFRFPGGCIIEGKDNDSYYDWKNSIGAVALSDGDKVPAFTYKLNDEGNVSTVTTYGEQTTRSYNTDIWYNGTYYQMEYGIGFYEYFLLCESLGAKAIPIVNCGYSCQTQSGTVGVGVQLSGRHGKKVNDFIQDAKDLIAFAKGSVTSSDANEKYWAQVRTNMGHPEPFEMDYIGIGNEQWGIYYSTYYEKFLDAFAWDENDLYRSVTPVVGNCTMFQHCENPATGSLGEAQKAARTYLKARGSVISNISEYGVHDQHYYMNYTDFLANAYLYDDYKRPDTDPDDYYEVFVGEYSANSTAVRSPQSNDNYLFNYTANSVITALSEAAMMTGFERNGDIVKLAAYAPMFGNATQNQWHVNMMFFNNTSLLLTPNYYAQQIFMKNAGDHKVTSSLTFAGEKPKTLYKASRGENRTLDDIYFVTSADEETGDVIVKLVNAGENSLKINLKFALTGTAMKGIADVTELSALTSNAVSTFESAAWQPISYTIGDFTDGTIGFEFQPYSITAIRIRTK